MNPSAAELIISAYHIRELFTRFNLTDSRSERRQLAAGALEDLAAHTKEAEQAFLTMATYLIKRNDLIEEARNDNDAMVSIIEKMRQLEPDSEPLASGSSSNS